MNKEERLAMVKAMETIARNLNDEEVFEVWLTDGVADGDGEDDNELMWYAEDDDTFADLMDTFAYVMKIALKGHDRRGVFYCDGISSKAITLK